MTATPLDRAPAESCEGTAGARLAGPIGARDESRPVGLPAVHEDLLALAAAWHAYAAEARRRSALFRRDGCTQTATYLRGEAASLAACAAVLDALLAGLEAR